MKKIQAVGQVIAAYGYRYGVQPNENSTIQSVLPCFLRGQDRAVVGDWVQYERCSADQGMITRILPRRNLLYRSEGRKSRRFASNVDQVLIMLAVSPYPNETLLGRTLVASQVQDLPVLIGLNKTDLYSALPAIRERLEDYKRLGYPVLEFSLTTQSEAAWTLLTPYLASRTTLVLGQSGTGKSTLINHFVPSANILTQEISTALGAGKHTTTATHLYHLDSQLTNTVEQHASFPSLGGEIYTDCDAMQKNAALIDSPGFQTFGLDHLSQKEIEQAFIEFLPLTTLCRFYNCRHLQEPDCAVRAAVQAGHIAQKRYALYQELATT